MSGGFSCFCGYSGNGLCHVELHPMFARAAVRIHLPDKDLFRFLEQTHQNPRYSNFEAQRNSHKEQRSRKAHETLLKLLGRGPLSAPQTARQPCHFRQCCLRQLCLALGALSILRRRKPSLHAGYEASPHGPLANTKQIAKPWVSMTSSLPNLASVIHRSTFGLELCGLLRFTCTAGCDSKAQVEHFFGATVLSTHMS